MKHLILDVRNEDPNTEKLFQVLFLRYQRSAPVRALCTELGIQEKKLLDMAAASGLISFGV